MSYSSEKKELLAAQIVKRSCCRTAFLYGLLYPHNSFNNNEIVFTTDSKMTRDLLITLFKQVFGKNAVFSKNDEKREESGYVFLGFETEDGELDRNMEELCSFFYTGENPSLSLLKCESCKINFLKGIFIASGTITNPEKSMHLELFFPSRVSGFGMKGFLEDMGLSPKEIERRGNYALYFKRHEEIEDFLVTIGDSQGAMQIMNLSIMKSLRNNANRYSNCDTANLYKATEAASAQIHAITLLMEHGLLEELSPDLQMTAHLRYEYPELTLAELAARHNPPITKSGVNHRLQKIIKAAQSL